MAALVLTRVIASMLNGVTPLDPVTLVMTAVLLGLTAMLACAAPALRAARVDPWWR
jgi:ABC-type lipoprotein release transport system permease subunit